MAAITILRVTASSEDCTPTFSQTARPTHFNRDQEDKKNGEVLHIR
jgi:hypothetical protein